jgi:hypothetical protein
MSGRPLSVRVAERLRQAAMKLGTADPVAPVKPLLDRTFALPEGDRRYAENALTPGAAPIEPSYSELQPGNLRYTFEPLGPDAAGIDRRDEATREMRRLVRDCFGREALRWFDGRSETWRGLGSGAGLHYGAFFGTAHDRDGLYASKVYYETLPQQIEDLPIGLYGMVETALAHLPGLRPLFTTIACQRRFGGQRLTFLHPAPLRLADLQPLMDALGLGRQLPGVMQIFGVALGGRFGLPANATLLALGLAERPRELLALERWLDAFTPESEHWPGRFSVLSVRTAPSSPPRVSLYLRPVEFEIARPLVADGAAQGDRRAA